MIQFIAAGIVFFLLIVFGIFLYYKYFKTEADKVYDIKLNDSVQNLLVLDELKNHRNQMKMLIPTYLSDDIYKDIQDKSLRNDIVLRDYFYLLDLANRAYHNGNTTVANVLQDEKYLPIAVFGKYIVDYEHYISDVPSEKMKAEFQSKFSLVPDIMEVMKFLNQVSQMYKDDRRSFDFVIFEKYAKVISDTNTCPSCTIKQEYIYVNVPVPVIQEQTTTNRQPTNMTQSETVTQPETPKPILSPNVEAIKGASLLEQFVDVYSKAIMALVQHKVEFYNLYHTKQTDVDFIRNANFAFVLRYTKFLADNQTQIDQLDQTEVMKYMKLAAPNFMTDDLYTINGMHVQVFIILASNLYQSNRLEVNKALSSLPI